ncbi:hypothetical protein KBTX_04452 [wastewater metagenome]|uniref:Uncharacterized protein n=2 Tax=unclassified sequences TaxID=12908 RepID=A0A5B8RK10_9ZZZZ|nr:hypothetical protein KBTEX_04452 [uncultured organism]
MINLVLQIFHAFLQNVNHFSLPYIFHRINGDAVIFSILMIFLAVGKITDTNLYEMFPF